MERPITIDYNFVINVVEEFQCFPSLQNVDRVVRSIKFPHYLGRLTLLINREIIGSTDNSGVLDLTNINEEFPDLIPHDELIGLNLKYANEVIFHIELYTPFNPSFTQPKYVPATFTYSNIYIPGELYKYPHF